MGELLRLGLLAVLAGAGAQLHAAALAVLREAMREADELVVGRQRVAAGRLLVAAGECMLAAQPQSATDGEARSWRRARLERLVELVHQAELALGPLGTCRPALAAACDVQRALEQLAEVE